MEFQCWKYINQGCNIRVKGNRLLNTSDIIVWVWFHLHSYLNTGGTRKPSSSGRRGCGRVVVVVSISTVVLVSGTDSITPAAVVVTVAFGCVSAMSDSAAVVQKK